MSNTVAAVDTTPTNHSVGKRSSDDWKLFDVPTEVFRKFEAGRNRFERWSKYLDEDDDEQASIKKYATRFPKNTIILRDSTSGVMRQIKRRI